MFNRLCLILIILSINFLPANTNYTIRGTVLSAEDGAFLPGANVYLQGTTIGATSNKHGQFSFSSLPAGEYLLIANFMGYSEQRIPISLSNADTVLTIRLDRKLISGPIIAVEASRIQSPLLPVTFSNIDKREFEPIYTTQDIPELLSDLPSTMYYSDAGNGIGYNYLSIRGFDQRRISVLINGIPQNDPEDHNVYWVDFPDLLANTQSIQVQRGGGNVFYGPAAIGGSINILTSYLSPERKLTASYGFGSFNTEKYSFSCNTGLLEDHFVFFGRVSRLKSDGYRDRAWVNFWSYFLGGAYYDKKNSLRLHFYGGPIEDGLVYNGLPKEYNSNTILRKKNYSWWEYGDNDTLYYAERRTDENENFNQPHLELLHEYHINSNLNLNNALFYVNGYGFFDYDGSWGWPEYYRLTPEYGYDITEIPADALIRAYVDNKQFGWLPKLIWRTEKNEITIGGEARIHRSFHWGRLQKGTGLPAEVVGENGRHFYEYKSAKDVFSVYYHQSYEMYKNLTALGNLQYSYKKYSFYDEKYLGNRFELVYQFINPRVGLNYALSKNSNIYMNVSHTVREPRLKNLYHGSEASGGELPKFEFTSPVDSAFDFNKPLVNPEALTGFELGYGFSTSLFRLTLNGYYMSFTDEIVKDGGLDQFGDPTTGNAEHTRHMGVEAGIDWQVLPQLALEANGVLSENELIEHTVYYENENDLVVPLSLDGNQIAGFPNKLGNISLIYSWKDLFIKGSLKYVGKMYTDNSQSEKYSVDPYKVINLHLNYNLKNLNLPQVSIQGRISNLLNSKYLAYGTGVEFFPAAERHWFVGFKIEY